MVSAIMFLGGMMLDYDMQCGCPFVIEGSKRLTSIYTDIYIYIYVYIYIYI